MSNLSVSKIFAEKYVKVATNKICCGKYRRFSAKRTRSHRIQFLTSISESTKLRPTKVILQFQLVSARTCSFAVRPHILSIIACTPHADRPFFGNKTAIFKTIIPLSGLDFPRAITLFQYCNVLSSHEKTMEMYLIYRHCFCLRL